jgi:(p)ppGpp synthase/HD superfamily hydrolase
MNLDKAIILATGTHIGQVDIDTQPYILHPLRVMLQFHGEEMQIIAVLHDIIETNPRITREQLLYSSFLNESIVDTIFELTQGKNEQYNDYIRRVAQHPTANVIKQAEMRDLLSESRMVWHELHQDYKKYKRQYEWTLEVLCDY